MKTIHIPSLMRLMTLSLGLLILLAFHGELSPPPGLAAKQAAADSAITLRLENYVAGRSRPLGIASAGDMRLFVIEQAGRIKIIQEDGGVRATPFLDIRNRVDASATEMGLLGMAFHPDYRQNGYFYVNYTSSADGVRRTRISRFSVSINPHVADPASEQILLTVDQPYSNHNAGHIAFGPDGYLYIPLGDGGSGGDPGDLAQNNGLLLGKISRIDVDGNAGQPADCHGQGTGGYTIPADNPLRDGQGNVCDEIWATGLRNPWQSTFDSRTGDLYVADVGQNKVEEVNFQPASSTGGENYGWRCYEGSATYNASGCASPSAYTFPVFEYTRPSPVGDCSVTGGYVYRGQRFQDLHGRYLLTDYCSGRFWDLQRLPEGNWQSAVHENVFPPDAGTTFGNAAFGQRCDGELFVANVEQGKVFYLTGHATPDQQPAAPASAQFPEADSWIYLPFIALTRCLPVP